MERSKIRLRNNVWERIESEAKRLNTSPLEALYFIIDSYFYSRSTMENINPNNPVANTPSKVEQSKPQYEYEIDFE